MACLEEGAFRVANTVLLLDLSDPRNHGIGVNRGVDDTTEAVWAVEGVLLCVVVDTARLDRRA